MDPNRRMTVDDALNHPWLQRVAPQEEPATVCPKVMERLISNFSPQTRKLRLQTELLIIFVSHMDQEDQTLRTNKETF